MAQTGPTEAFRAQFNDRLGALSRVQGLLSRSSEERITLGQLLHLEFDALSAEAMGDRIRLEGPEVPLRSAVVQTLALALHELATNARKYGALATQHGTLHVTWSVTKADGAERRLVLEWVELGVVREREARSAEATGARCPTRSTPRPASSWATRACDAPSTCRSRRAGAPWRRHDSRGGQQTCRAIIPDGVWKT